MSYKNSRHTKSLHLLRKLPLRLVTTITDDQTYMFPHKRRRRKDGFVFELPMKVYMALNKEIILVCVCVRARARVCIYILVLSVAIYYLHTHINDLKYCYLILIILFNINHLFPHS